MSVLYVGPYRQTNTDGQIARFFLTDLTNRYGKEYVISRPMYAFDSGGVLSNNIVFYTENTTTKERKHCIYVQHMPIAHMQYMPDIAASHYAFPILDTSHNFGINKKLYDILYYYDKIFVMSQLEKQCLLDNCSSIDPDKVYIFTPEIDQKAFQQICSHKKYEFRNYTGATKFYFIGNMDTDEKIIKKILFSLYCNTKNKTVSPICVFFLDFDTQPDLQKLDDNIKQMKLEFGISTDQSKELFIFKHFTEEDLIVAHNSCDIYLSINEDKTQYLQEQYAKLCNNKVISLDDIFDTTIPHMTKEYNYSYEINKRYISTQKLVSVIRNAIK